MDHTAIRPGRFWWIAIVRGIFSVLLGTAVLITEGNRAKIVDAVGVYWLLVGLLTIRWAITVRWRRGSQIGLLAGSVSVIAALLVLFREQLQDTVSANILIDVLGAAAFLTGVLRVLGAFELERRTGQHWTFGGLALGSTEVVLGVILFFADQGDVHVITIALATWGLVGGGLLLIEGARLHQAWRTDSLEEISEPRPGS
jgi:uncharacterized membrane protein HdeD (DUF308 family)